jgi:hypothetical protein
LNRPQWHRPAPSSLPVSELSVHISVDSFYCSLKNFSNNLQVDSERSSNKYHEHHYESSKNHEFLPVNIFKKVSRTNTSFGCEWDADCTRIKAEGIL